MCGEKADNWLALRRSLGAVSPPQEITQEAYEGDSSHLYRLLRLQPGERPRDGDLSAYMHDLNYAEIQSSLFVYMLPMFLEMWRNELRGIDNSYGGVVEYFYPVLANRKIFELHLTPKQTETVSEFMREGILEEIDDQRGLAFQGMAARPYRWIRALTTYGVILPDVGRLWNTWWSIDTVGRAVAAVQYISCLMYSQHENPIFSPWTPNGGGGPPCLWEFEGHLYTNRWLESNVAFLRSTLYANAIADVLGRAVKRLAEQPEYPVAAEVQSDLPLCESMLISRCHKLPSLLATINEPGSAFDWLENSWQNP